MKSFFVCATLAASVWAPANYSVFTAIRRCQLLGASQCNGNQSLGKGAKLGTGRSPIWVVPLLPKSKIPAANAAACVYPWPISSLQGHGVSLWLFSLWLWAWAGDAARCGVGGRVAGQSQILLLLGLFSVSLDQKVLKLTNSVEAVPECFNWLLRFLAKPLRHIVRLTNTSIAEKKWRHFI